MEPGRETNIDRPVAGEGEVGGGGTRRASEPQRDRGGVDEVVRSDNMNWKAITAGALATVATFLLLGLLALGIDLLADDSGVSDWVSAIIGLIAFFVGGYVAGKALNHKADGRRGLLNGLLSWALATVTILVLSGLGLSHLFGPVGDMMGSLDTEQISQAARDAALGAFITLLLWALMSALGGWLGEKSADRSPDVHTIGAGGARR